MARGDAISELLRPHMEEAQQVLAYHGDCIISKLEDIQEAVLATGDQPDRTDMWLRNTNVSVAGSIDVTVGRPRQGEIWIIESIYWLGIAFGAAQRPGCVVVSGRPAIYFAANSTQASGALVGIEYPIYQGEEVVIQHPDTAATTPTTVSYVIRRIPPKDATRVMHMGRNPEGITDENMHELERDQIAGKWAA